MEKDTIIEVVNKLTGECYPYGSESIDGDRYNNLLLKQWVVDELMRDILDAGRLYNRSEYSILRISNKANQWLTEWRDILNYIEYLPPAETGGWEVDRDGDIICSECGRISDYYIEEVGDCVYDTILPKFCGWCGARMDGGNK